ncbi:hypothetical protein [Halioglobus maricola]|uniref:hypothetical protein n=1 Tax=Halioglobus maricola TaxID=2601894 RepID=UPI00197A996D|nr:hypothetical protein [Halioglobus maricola]
MKSTNVETGARLRCRGCTQDCAYYEICDGRPWREMDPEMAAGAAVVETDVSGVEPVSNA